MTDQLFDPESGEVFDDGEPGQEEPTPAPIGGCRRCGVLAAELQQKSEDLAGSERDYRRARRENGKLRKELEEKHENSVKKPIAQAIFDKWVELSGRNPKQVKLGEKRIKALYARIGEGFDDLDYWEVAIAGFVAGHHVDDKGKHHDDLELLARNEVNLEKHHRGGEELRTRPAPGDGPPIDDAPPWAV